MRKLYTQYSSAESNTPFMVTFEGNQIQACANDADVVTIGSTEYVRVTDGRGHNVKAVIPNSGDEKAHQLIIRLGESTTHDLCYIEDDGVASSTSIQVIDIQPTPQETVITYTRSSASSEYIADTQMVGTIPTDAYLTWEMVDRPTTNIEASDYNIYCRYTVGSADRVLMQAVGYGLTAYSTEIPIKAGNRSNPSPIPNVSLALDRSADNNLLECIKRVEYRQDSVNIEIENIEDDTTRTVETPYILEFQTFAAELNSAEGNSAIQHLGSYLDFRFEDADGNILERTPTVQLHIPNT